MSATHVPDLGLPRHKGSVTVRRGGLDDDLDRIHEGDPLWWGKEFLAERVRSMPPDTPHLMFIGELAGEPVADASIIGRPIRARGFAAANVYVLPRARGHGVGRALVQMLAEATQALDLPGFSTSAHEDDQHSVDVARHWGFEVAGHHRESVLDLDALDQTVVHASIRRAEESGVRIEAVREDADDAAWQQVYQTLCASWLDAPDSVGSGETMPYSVFRGFLPDSSYVLLAWRDGVPVGITALSDRAKDQALNTFFTGVSASARGLGVATALKASHAWAMRARGQHRIFTQNMDQNAPILAANDRLGFRVVTGFYDLARSMPWT